MSLLDLDLDLKTGSSNSLVDRILEQGQRLRNSMVQTILNNDPFNQEFLQNSNYNQTAGVDLKKDSLSSKCTCHKKPANTDAYQAQLEHFDKYLRGEEMTVNDEIRALESIASLPSTSFKKYSSCCLMGHYKKGCDLCKEYENKMVASSNYFSSSVDMNDDYTVRNSRNVNHFLPSHRHHKYVERKKVLNEIENVEIDAPVPMLKLHEKSSNFKMKTAKNTKIQSLLKYVDSLKITVYSLKLNSAGNRKVTASESTNKAYLTTANTYFVEYVLPDLLSKTTLKTKAKINTGLNPDKTIRYCSKKLESESIYFRQQSIHLISNVNLLDLSNVEIEFRVSFRSMKQRVALLIGKAVFNLGTLTVNQFLSCEQELVLVNESAPVVLGSLKVSFQFGCDKLYFGKEFIGKLIYFYLKEILRIFKSFQTPSVLVKKTQICLKMILYTNYLILNVALNDRNIKTM